MQSCSAIRKVMAQESLAPVIEEEMEPGRASSRMPRSANGPKRAVTTMWHPVGTCRMGRDEQAVVDARLRVRGSDGLRVIDASICRTLLAATPMPRPRRSPATLPRCWSRIWGHADLVLWPWPAAISTLADPPPGATSTPGAHKTSAATTKNARKVGAFSTVLALAGLAFTRVARAHRCGAWEERLQRPARYATPRITPIGSVRGLKGLSVGRRVQLPASFTATQ